MKGTLVLVFVALSGATAYAQERRAAEATATMGEGSLACIQEMLLSSYGLVARKAKQPGTVATTVKIGPNGILESLSSESSDPFLAREVEIFLRHNSTFRRECSGQELKLRFTFVLKGNAVLNPTVNTRFRGPNEFVIESQPQSERIEYGPAPAKK